MVTSFRAKDPLLVDDSVLNTVRGVSNLSELYYGYGTYRLEMLEARIADKVRQIRARHAEGQGTDTKALKQFLEDSIKFLDSTNAEIVQDEDVVPGHQPTLDIANVQVAADSESKALKAKL